MASKVDMSLDDIIKADKTRSRGRGRGRAGLRRGTVRGRGGLRGRGTYNQTIRQVTSGRIRKPRRGGVMMPSPSARWEHDRYEGGIASQTRRRGGGPGSRSLVKLVLSNLDFGVNDQDLKELFGEFGGFVKAYVHYDISGRSNGTAFILFSSFNAAEQARKQYHGVQLDGRPMDIQVMGSNSPASRAIPSRIEGMRGGRGGARGGVRGARIGRGGRSRGRGRGRGGSINIPTKEELDSQLDNYHSRTD